MKGKILKSGKSLISLVLVAMMVVSLFSMNVSAANVEKAQAAVSDTSSVTNDNDDSSATKDIDDSSSKQDSTSSSKVDKTRNKSTNLDSAGANVNLNDSGVNTWTISIINNDNGNTLKTATISGSTGNTTLDLSAYSGWKVKVMVLADGQHSQTITSNLNEDGTIKDGTKYTMTWHNNDKSKVFYYLVPTSTDNNKSVKFTIDVSGLYNYITVDSGISTPTDTTYYIRGRFLSNWSTDTTAHSLTKDTSTGYYKFETNKTIADLSKNGYDNNAPQYFYIQEDGKTGQAAGYYGSSNSLGHKLQDNTSSKPLSMVTGTADDVKNYLRFSDTTDTDTKNVVIWFDPTNKKIWYTSDSDPISTEGYSIKINNKSYSFNYNSNKNKYLATAAITVPADSKEIPFEFAYKANSTSDPVIYTAGGYWLAGVTTTTKTMSQADASTDKFYVGSPIKAGGTVTLYFIYDKNANTLTVSTEKPTNRLYIDLVYHDSFEPYLNCTHSQYSTKFSVDNYLEAEITSPSGKETVKLNYNTANIFGTRKGIFAGNFPDSVFEATSIKFTLKNKSGTQLATYSNSSAPTKAGEIFTYDSNASNHCGWDSYNTYMVGSEKRKESTLKDLGIDLSEKGKVDSANPNGDKYGTSTYIFFDNSATKWAQLYLYVWDNDKNTTGKLDSGHNEKRYEMTKLITNDEDRAYQIEKYGHTVDVSDLWVFDVRDLFIGTSIEKETKAKAWLSNRVFTSGVDAGILFIDRGPNKTFPQHYSYSVDIGDWTVNTYDPATKKNGTQALKFSTTYKEEYYPCFLSRRFLDCTQEGGGDELKYRAYTDGFYDLLQDETTNNIRLASVTVYIDMHSTPSAVYMDILSTCHDEFNYADIINRQLQRLGTSTVYSATFNLPFDYTTVKSGLSQYASPMFKFSEISAGSNDNLTHYTLSAKAQPSGKCAKDDYGTGEVWLEATDLALNGTNSKSLVSSSSASSDLVASSSPAKAKEIIASGADVDVIDSGFSIKAGYVYVLNVNDWSGVNMYYWGNGWNNNQAYSKIDNTNIYYFNFPSEWTNLSGIKFNQAKDDWDKQWPSDGTSAVSPPCWFATDSTSAETNMNNMNGGAKVINMISTDGGKTYKQLTSSDCITTISGYNLSSGSATATKKDAKTSNINSSAEFDAAYGSTVSLSASAKNGYIFKGFSSTNSSTLPSSLDATVSYTAKAYDGDDNTTYYAYYLIETKSVTFNANGHGTAPANQTVEDGKTATKPTDPTATGYTFGGWYTDSACTTEYNFTTPVTADITLYAKWTAKTPTVSFDANGGSTPTPANKTVTYDGTYGDLATTTRTGYTFAGWFTTKTGTTQVTSATKVTNENDHILYAHWTANKYNVETVCSYGTLSFTSGVTSGKASTGSAVKFKVTPNTGHRVDVVQYRMTSGGTSTTLTADASGVYSFTMPAGDVTITASIVPKTCKVTFDYQGGEESTASKYVTYGTKYDVLPTTTRRGYTFAGWFTKADGGTEVTADTIYEVDGDSTLYAHWTANKYTVTAKAGANGSITNSGAKEYDYDSKVTFTATPADGYKVSKWIVNGVDKPAADTYEYKVTDADNQTVEVQFVEQDKTVIYVGMIEYCFNSSDADSYIATPKYKIGSTTYSLPTNKNQYEEAYFYISNWGSPRKFYVKKIELTESDLASGSKVSLYNGINIWGTELDITDGNYYLAYNYGGHKFISEAPADLLHTFTVDSSITGGKVAVTGQDYKVDSTYYAKAGTTITATATATGEGYNFSSWNFSDGITKLTEEGTKATFKVTANNSKVSAVFSNEIKLIINSASYVTATYNGVEFTDKKEFIITDDTAGTKYEINFDIPDEEHFCFDKFDITGSGVDAVITYVDNTKKKHATVTVTRGSSNIVITPVIRSNVDGVTVNAYDQSGTAFNAFDGSSTKVFPGHIGSSVKLTAPAVDGYKFVGWYTSDGKYLLSKNTSYTIEGEVFTGSMSVRAVYSNEQQYFGILSYSHYTYTLKSQNGTVEDIQEPDKKSPIVKTTGGYTGTEQKTGVITKNGDNDFTVVYADVDKETMPTFGETLSAQSKPNNESYSFSGWMDNGVTVVSGGSTQTLAFVFGDTSNGTTAPFGEKTIVAVWVDALYDINMKYKYNAYDGKVAMEENYDLSESGKDAPAINREVKNIGLSTFLANLEEFAKDYAPIVNDVYYDYVFKYEWHIVDEDNHTITYNAVADYTKTSAQKYSVVKGGNSENFTIAYVKPDKVTPAGTTDYAYYNWIAECTSEQAVMEDGSRYFLWYTYTDSGKVEVLLCSNTLNTYKMRLTSANTVKKVYLLVGEAGTAFNGKTLADYAIEENITINGNNVIYTNIDNQTYMHFRVDVNCPSNYTIEKMGVIFYYAADSVNTGTADKKLPDNFDNTMENGTYKVTEAGLKDFANGATKDGTWVASNDTDAYGFAYDLTANRNSDNQVILGLAADNNNDYYCNYVFVGYVTYSYVDDSGNNVTDTIFTEFYNSTIPTEYYKGGQKA